MVIFSIKSTTVKKLRNCLFETIPLNQESTKIVTAALIRRCVLNEGEQYKTLRVYPQETHKVAPRITVAKKSKQIQ